MFNLVSDYKPTGDQPQAIDKLSKGILDGKKFQTLFRCYWLTVRLLLWLILFKKFKNLL